MTFFARCRSLGQSHRSLVRSFGRIFYPGFAHVLWSARRVWWTTHSQRPSMSSTPASRSTRRTYRPSRCLFARPISHRQSIALLYLSFFFRSSWILLPTYLESSTSPCCGSPPPWKAICGAPSPHTRRRGDVLDTVQAVPLPSHLTRGLTDEGRVHKGGRSYRPTWTGNTGKRTPLLQARGLSKGDQGMKATLPVDGKMEEWKTRTGKRTWYVLGTHGTNPMLAPP